MATGFVVGALLGATAMILSACGSDDRDVNRGGTVGVATIRECLRVAGSLPEDPPTAIQGLPKLNSLVRRADRGVVRTPPADRTFTGSVVAYFLVFDDPESAGRAAAAGRDAVLEFRHRFRDSVGPDADYELAEVNRNVLALYLEDPSDADAQKEAIGSCIREAPDQPGASAMRPRSPRRVVTDGLHHRYPEESADSLARWLAR